MTDIVERLRNRALAAAIIKDKPDLYNDAADAIIRLCERLAEADEANRRVSDESEKLRHELITSSDAAKYYDYGYSCARDMQKDEITRLRAENEKLREALRPYADKYHWDIKHYDEVMSYGSLKAHDFYAAAEALGETDE